MDPIRTGDIYKHLEKQNELLMETYRSMSHELHRLQVEEEMLMRKFYEIMTTHGKVKQIEDHSKVSDDGRDENSTAVFVSTTDAEE